MRFARGVAKALPDILNTLRCRMNSAKIEPMDASIQRIVSKQVACRMFSTFLQNSGSVFCSTVASIVKS